MAEDTQLAFVQNALSVLGVNAPVEGSALLNELFRRLLLSGIAIDTAGNITATALITTTPNVSAATGTLAVGHGGTGATTLTGLVKGTGTTAMVAVAAPAGVIVGDTDTQTLSGKTISGAANTLTVRAASDITGLLPVAVGGTGIGTLTGLVKGNGTSAMSAVTAPAGAVVGDTDTQTLTNKTVTPRVTTIVSNATPTINTDACDVVTITALAAAITSMTTNLSGTPVNFQKLVIRFKDNGTARAITWGASFVAKGTALPTTTVISKLLTVGFLYDTVAGTWGCVGSQQEA